MKKALIITKNLDLSTGWGRYSSEILKRLEKNFNISLLTEESGLRKLNNVFAFISNIFLTKRRAIECEVVHAFDGWPYAIYGYLAVLGTNKKFFINAVGTYSIAPLDMGFVRSFLLRKAYLRANKVFAISNYTKEELKKRVNGANVELVHLGTTDMASATEHFVKKVKDKIQSRSPVILTVGALKRRKGQLDTSHAVLELKKTYPNILYVSVGNDSDEIYKQSLISFSKENNLEENILILGSVNDSELSAWYESADVFALNSVNYEGNFEGFGLVILEGYQFGVPAVGSRNCGVEDAIIEGETGYLCNQNDPADIARQIERALELKNKQKIIDFGRSFDWGKATHSYSKAYRYLES